VEIGEECVVGALCFIKSGEKIPRRSLVVGNPGKIIREVTDEMLAWKTEGTRLYQQLPGQCYDSLRPCEPLREIPDDQPEQEADYTIWKKRKS
jgi:phenylacetic acid degradation protein